MKHIIKSVFTTIFVSTLLVSYKAGAQDMPKVIPPSPSTQQFMKYVDYPNGEFTGVPDISIPLYEIQDGDIKIPITLKYDASGARPSAVAGLVGLGWTLSSFGKISRNIMGRPDEMSTALDTFYTTDQLTLQLDPWVREKYFYDLSKYSRDIQPDEYTYYVNGHHGKFVLDPNNSYQPLLLPYAPLKIEGHPYNPTWFTITDEKGIIYKFSDSETINTGSYSGAPSAWDISQIISPTDPSDTIKFSNITARTEHFLNRTDEIWVDDNASQDEIATACGNATTTDDMIDYPGWNASSNYSDLIYQITSSANIKFRSGQVVFSQFTTGDFAGMVSKMEVFDNSQRLMKSVEFVYSHKLNSKDILKRLDFYDANHALSYSYKFDYYDETEEIPDPSTAKIDYWGYYAGGTLEQHGYDLIPKFNISFNEAGRTAGYTNSSATPRQTDVAAMKTLVLNKITFPTGGFAVYDFEANQYLPNVIPNFDGTDVGGLRIKSITHYDSPSSPPHKKIYKYGDGIMDFEPGHIEDYTYSEEVVIPSWSVQTSNFTYFGQTWTLFRRRHFLSEPTFNLCPHGSPVVYTEVTEYDDGTVDNGGTKYYFDYTPIQKYSLNTNGTYVSYTSNVPNLYAMHLPFIENWKSGNLISKYTFKANNIPVSGEDYTYSDAPTSLSGIRGMLIEPYVYYDDFECTYGPPQGDGPYNYIYNYAFSAFNFGDYEYLSSYHHLTQKSYTQFDPNGQNPVTTTTNFIYGNTENDQPTKSTTTSSTGDNLITRYKYPHDFAGTQPYTDMVNTYHIWNPVVERLDYKNVEDSGHFLQSTKTDYSTWNSNAAQIYPATVSTKKGAGSYESRIQYQAYDGQGNVASVSKAGGPKVNYIWGYGGAYPVAQVNNADYTAIVTALGGQSAVDAFRNTPIPLDVDVNTFLAPLRNVANLPNAQVTTYTYDPLVGMTSMTDPRGNKTTYEYDNFQRLINVKDQNGNIKTRYCYNYAGASVGCLVAATPIPPDPIPDPPVGIYVRIEITDVGYEYYGDETEYSSYQTGNVCIKLYSDPACTIPLTLSYDLPVVMDLSDDILDDVNGNSTEPSYATYTITAGNNSYCLGSMDLDDLYHYQDEFGNPHYQEFIYHYDLVPGSTVYRNKPAVTF